MSHRFRLDGPNKLFHISSRVNWRAWHLAGERAKQLLARLIREAAAAHSVRVLAGVLMSNHLHMVAQSPPPALFRTLTGRRTRCRHFRPWPAGHQNSSVIAQFMRSLRHRMSVAWQKELELSGHFWDSRYDARAIESLVSLAVRIAYDHRNPVKAAMVNRPEDYPWSSAGEWVTGETGRFPISPVSTPLFGASPEQLRALVLEQQRCDQLDQIGDTLDRKLWTANDLPAADLIALLEGLGIPTQCGIDAAND